MVICLGKELLFRGTGHRQADGMSDERWYLLHLGHSLGLRVVRARTKRFCGNGMRHDEVVRDADRRELGSVVTFMGPSIRDRLQRPYSGLFRCRGASPGWRGSAHRWCHGF